jgi:hypothetical protein
MQGKVFFLRLATVIGGIVFGLFLGLFLIGSALRIFFDLIFGWGDSGPTWINWLIIFITFLAIMASCYIFLLWTNSYINRKGLSIEKRRVS